MMLALKVYIRLPLHHSFGFLLTITVILTDIQTVETNTHKHTVRPYLHSSLAMKTARRYFLVTHPIRNFVSPHPHQTQYDGRDSMRETAHRLVRHSTTQHTIEGNFYSPGVVTKGSNVQTDFPPLPHKEELLRKATTRNHRSKTSVTKTSYSIRTD